MAGPSFRQSVETASSRYVFERVSDSVKFYPVATSEFSPATHSHTFIAGIAGSNTTYTSGTVQFTGAGIVTVASTTGQQFIISATESTHSHATFPSALIASNGTFTSGSVFFSGLSNITVSTNGTGTQQTILFSAPNPPSAPTTGWGSISNVTPTRTYDADAVAIDQLADALGTLVSDLIAQGVLSA